MEHKKNLTFISENLFMSGFLIIFFQILFLNYFAHADYIDPSEIQVKTEKYLPESTDFPLGSFIYTVSWQGIPVAEAEVTVGKNIIHEKEVFNVEANTKTNNVISIFYKLRHTSSSTFDSENLKPIHFVSRQTENSRKRREEVSFKEDGTISSVTEKNGKVKSARDFNTNNQTLDPISAAFLARSIPIDIGKKVSFDVYNGKNRYLISFEVISKEKISVPSSSEKRDAFKVIPSVKKLTDSEGENRFMGAEIWIAADRTRDVLKMESEVFVGSVSSVLKEFIPLVSPLQTNHKKNQIIASKPE